MGTLTDALNDMVEFFERPLFDPDDRAQYLLEQNAALSALEDRRNDCLSNPDACTLTGNEYVNEKNRLETNISFHEEYINNWDIYGSLVESAIFAAGGAAIGIVKTGLPASANFAQKSYSKYFTYVREDGGHKIYSELAGYAIRTVDDLTGAIVKGDIKVNDLPINTIVRDGKTLILNTRTTKALEAAGIDRKDFKVNDVTGVDLHEFLLDRQLTHNKLTSDGIAEVRQSFRECFGPQVMIDMWPHDPAFSPDPENLGKVFDQDAVRSKVWKKPISLIEVGDWVVSFDKDENLVPGYVPLTMTNDVKILLDYFGTEVTPGHVYYRPDSKLPEKFETLIDVLRDDGIIQKQDGSHVRAATNVPVGDPLDGFVQAITGTLKADGQVYIRQRGRIRLGTRFIVHNGKERKSYSVADLIKAGGGIVGDDELIRVGDSAPMPFHWEFGNTLPKPEDYVLACSGTSLEKIYGASEWEQQRPHLPAPMVMDGGPVQPLSATAISAMPRNEPLNVIHDPMAQPAKPQRTLNRKQRKAMEAKERKARKRSAVS